MTHSGYIYFIQAVSGGPIKIGYSANPQSRLAALQIGHPEELRIIGSLRAPRTAERAIHRALSEYRTFGEWFSPNSAVSFVVEGLSDPGRHPEFRPFHARIEQELLA